MAGFQVNIPNDPLGNNFYYRGQSVLTASTSTSLTFENGDFKLVLAGVGITAAGAGTITGARLYQIDLSSGSPIEVLVVQNTTALALTVAGLLQAIVPSPYTFEFGAFTYTLSGNDTLTGSAGDDWIAGYAGKDVLNGLGGNDNLYGGDGNDTINGGDGNDMLYGGGFYNALSASGTGSDSLVGGAGDDLYYVDGMDDVVVEAAGGGNFDRVDLTLTTGSADYVLAANVENLDITQYSFGAPATLTASGNALSNKISVVYGTGAEKINGLGGNDRIFTGDGDDTIDGGTGNDTMIGGNGDDTYVVDSAGDSVTEGASQGDDIVRASRSYTLGANVERLMLTGTSAINGTGNDLANVLYGNDAANSLIGGVGNDVLFGGAGADRLIGGLGDDALIGETGVDTLLGGLGDDFYFVRDSGDVVTELAGEGSDGVQAEVTYALAANVERLTLTGGSAIDGTGNALDNRLSGNDASNRLSGSGGNDTLIGGAGRDTLIGGVGTDVLMGGVGNDTLTGGTDADAFKFVTIAEGTDSLTDFASGSDKIQVVSTNFGNLPIDALAASLFKAEGTALSNANPVFLYNAATGALSFDSNGSDAGGVSQIATLTGPKTLLFSDIQVVAA